MSVSGAEREHILVEVDDAGEHRCVTVLEGGSVALFEQTSGPVTQAAYGSTSHTHKVLVSREACARALGVSCEKVAEALQELFAGDGDPAQLSDVMDLLDGAGERYTYVSWTSGGDAVYRA